MSVKHPADMSTAEFVLTAVAGGFFVAQVIAFPWLALATVALAGSAWCLVWLWDNRSAVADTRRPMQYTAEEMVKYGVYDSVENAVATYADFKSFRLRRKGEG